MNEQAKSAYDLSGDAAKVIFEVFLAALPVALLYSLILMVVCTVLIVVMHKRRLYTRQHKLWSALTKLHYPLWLLIFAATGFALGFIGSIQSSADRAIDEQLHPAIAGVIPPIQQKLIDSLPPELSDESMTGQAMYDYVLEHAVDEEALKQAALEAENFFERIGVEIQGKAQRVMAQIALDSAIKQAGQQVGMAEDEVKLTVETFKSIDFGEEADAIAGKVTTEVKKQVGSISNGFRLNILVCCGGLLLLLLIEPLIYYKFWLPRSLKRTPEVVEPSEPLP